MRASVPSPAFQKESQCKMYMGEDLILVWKEERRLRQAWIQAGIGARERLMFAFLCRAVQGVETFSLLQYNGKIQGNSQPDVHQGQQESPALPEEMGEKKTVP